MKLKLLALVSVFALTQAALAQTPLKAGPSPEAIDRRARSVARLAAESITIPPDLPVIADAGAAKLRTREQIAQRAIAVCFCALKAEGASQDTIEDLIQRYKAKKFFTAPEWEFVDNNAQTNSDRNVYLWHYEGLVVLMWALGYGDELARPDTTLDVKQTVGYLSSRTVEQFIAEAKPRTAAEILDEADLIQRYRWAINDANKRGKSAPAGLDRHIVEERAAILNWLIGK